MPPRDTRTGAVLESIILPALTRGGYTFRKQVLVGARPGGRDHKIDVLAQDKAGHSYLVSMKWQQVGGTAEQKVPFEVICLVDIMTRQADKFRGAYLVLGGTVGHCATFYIAGGLAEYIKHTERITITDLEHFVAKANKGGL
jgi:hypothetical protein